jgi:hypothetical protein
MNVAQWLNAIDLGQYEALFREHEIDANVLPDLVEADLEKIGVPLGHRKRLMRAIAALSAGGTPPSAAKPAFAQPSPSRPTSGAEAERRPIRVMFFDLAGSTSLAAKLDAEDSRNLVNAYLDEASRAVTALGGHVLKMLGDGLMTVFGYPRAQENDAERAVRAALAIQRALGERNAGNAAKGAPELPRASGSSRDRSWSRRAAKCSAKRPISRRAFKARRSPEWSLSLRPCRSRPPGCSWPKTAAHASSKACRRSSRFTASCGRAAGGARAHALSPPSPGARRSSTCCAGAGSGRAPATASSRSLSANRAWASRVS